MQVPTNHLNKINNGIQIQTNYLRLFAGRGTYRSTTFWRHFKIILLNFNF